MKLLLDTHTFIWWDSEPHKLSARVLALCQDPTNTLTLSVVSLWEIQLKRQLGRLTLRLPLAQIVEDHHNSRQLDILPVLLPHVLALDALPDQHKDPFDRLLIAQVSVENMVLLSRDPIMASYPVQVIW